MFSIPMLSGVRLSSYTAGGSIGSPPNRCEVFRRPARCRRGPASASTPTPAASYTNSRSDDSDGSSVVVSGRIRGPRLAAAVNAGKVHLIEIYLDKGLKPVFEPGEEVKGRVMVKCSGNLKFRSLSVTMKGMARVHWTEYRARNNERYNAEVEYFKKKR
jgi:hypothetical protein